MTPTKRTSLVNQSIQSRVVPPDCNTYMGSQSREGEGGARLWGGGVRDCIRKGGICEGTTLHFTQSSVSSTVLSGFITAWLAGYFPFS